MRPKRPAHVAVVPPPNSAASRSRGYLCVSCEETALAAQVRRRSVLQWWPVALIVVLVCTAGAGLGWAIKQNQAPDDPVTPGEH